MQIFFYTIGILFVLIFLEIMRELHTFRTTHYNVAFSKLPFDMPELKIAVLSDLHNCLYGRNNKKLLCAIEKETPDVILVAGDMLVGVKDKSTLVAEEFMKEVSKIAPVFYGNGNHEQRMKVKTEKYGDTYRKYKRALLESGIVFLENESAVFLWHGESIRVTGFEIPLSYYKKFSNKHLSVSEIEEKIGVSEKQGLQILIAHNPVHGDTYGEWGADLVLSGHLHGGIVRIPFLGGVITPQMKLFPKYSGGMYQREKTTLVVSKGLGTHTFPIRLFNEAELVMLHVTGKKEEAWDYQ